MNLNPSQMIKVSGGSLANLDYTINYIEIVSDEAVTESVQGSVPTGAPTPGLILNNSTANEYIIEYISVYNADVESKSISFVKTDGTDRNIVTGVLLPSESFHYSKDAGWYILDSSGRKKQSTEAAVDKMAISTNFYKSGTAPEAAGQYYCFAKDGGFPGAMTLTSGTVAGVALDSSRAGALVLPTELVYPAKLVGFSSVSSVAAYLELKDMLWLASGFSATALTAQSVNSVAFPARDKNNSSDGVGVIPGILVTTVTGNAGVVTVTLSYTNSAGTPGRTGTLSMPATAVAGTWIPFSLGSGDSGVRSIESFTLAATLTSGAFILTATVDIAPISLPVANIGYDYPSNGNPFGKIPSAACIVPFVRATGTTAMVVAGSASIRSS